MDRSDSAPFGRFPQLPISTPADGDRFESVNSSLGSDRPPAVLDHQSIVKSPTCPSQSQAPVHPPRRRVDSPAGHAVSAAS
jgi:hypothetical protein